MRTITLLLLLSSLLLGKDFFRITNVKPTLLGSNQEVAVDSSKGLHVEDTTTGIDAKLTVESSGNADDAVIDIKTAGGSGEDPFLRLIRGDTTFTMKTGSDNQVIFNTDQADGYFFQVHDTFAATIDSVRYFGLGTQAPGEKFHMYSATASIFARIETDVATGVAGLDLLGNASTDGADYAQILFRTTTGTSVGRITSERGSASNKADLVLYSGNAGQQEGIRIDEDQNSKFSGDAEIGSADAFYLGDPSTDGSWRITRSGSDLVFQRRESSSWVTKSTITP